MHFLHSRFQPCKNGSKRGDFYTPDFRVCKKERKTGKKLQSRFRKWTKNWNYLQSGF